MSIEGLTLSALQNALRILAGGEDLSANEAQLAFDQIMKGNGNSTQVAALLMGMRVKGETAEEVAGVARALREAMLRLDTTHSDGLVDTCGTGGGKLVTFNISTAAAFVAAGAGVRIAKHGNRSFTSRSGSADVLEALGIAVDVPVQRMSKALEAAGITFMFAPRMHPAMRHVGPVRRELAVPTVMNMVGPLANPALAGRQVVGVADSDRMRLIAGALAELGSVRAMVVHGEPGIDEISPIGTTHVLEVKNGDISEWTIDPKVSGIENIKPEHLDGGEPVDNARIIEEVLEDGGLPGARAAVLLNSAAAIYIAGLADTFVEAIEKARTSLSTGAGMEVLRKLRAALGPEE